MKSFFLVLFCAAFSFAALSEDVHSNFVGSCVDGGSSELFCECVFSKVEHKYTQAQIDAIELKMRRGHSDLGYTNFVKNASKECEAKIKSGASLGAFAATEDESNKKNQRQISAEEAAALESLGLDADFAQGVMSALLESPEYKNVFMAECSVELRPYLNLKQAANTCECGYQKLITGGNVQKILNMVDANGNINEAAVVDIFLPCLPKNYTPEMEKFLMDSCQTVATKNVCSCIVQDVKKHFTLQDLVRKTLSSPTFIQGYATGAAIRCKDE